MTDPPADKFAADLKSKLKELGFKKSGLNWRRSTADAIHVFNVQKSQWGPEFYVNLGVYLVALGPEEKPPHNRCQVRQRLPHDDKTPEDVLSQAEAWFTAHGSVDALAKLAKQDALPAMTSIDAKEYLGHNN